MANVLWRSVEWLVEFVREVDLGIAVGSGYEPPGKNAQTGYPDSRARRGLNRRCRERTGEISTAIRSF